MADDRSVLLVIDELRRDDDLDSEREREALSRVAERLSSRPSRVVRRASFNTTAECARPSRFDVALRSGTLAALLVGTALGAGGKALVAFVSQPSAKAVVATAKAPEASVQRAASPVAPHAVPELSSTAAPSASPAPDLPKPSAMSLSGGDFDLELRMLESARRAVAVGDGAAALSVLERHARRHPKSVLGQERDVLNVKALVVARRHAEARRAGELFRRRYPDSALRASVERALESIP